MFVGVFFALLLVSASVLAAEGDAEQTGEDEGYACLADLVENKASFSLQEAVFGVLAVGGEKELLDVIKDEEGNDCWPRSSCKIKETSQVLLAKQRIGQNTGDVVDYLLEKNKSVSELTWLLEVDITNHEASTCTVSYDRSDVAIQVNEDMTLSGNGGSCLSIDSGGYWLSVAGQCLGKTFEVSCDQDFVTTLLYRKPSGGTVFVSSETHSAASLGTTEETVRAQCFKSSAGAGCDYEGSLWATLALLKAGEDVSNFVPYLLALADEHKRFFPSAFLLTITGGNDHFSNVVQAQKQNKYWQAPASANSRFYDTSLALLALQGGSAAEAQQAKDYLLEIQGKDGCWNNQNFRDTAFVLYSGFPRAVSGTTGGGSGGGTVFCETQGFSCEGSTECLNAGGEVKSGLECSGFGQFCCSVSVPDLLCLEREGVVCPSNLECVGGLTVSARDGSCCLGTCQVREESTCELFGGSCRFACSAGEQQTSESCGGSGQVCCEAGVINPDPEPSGRGIWIWVLLILIVLVVIGIVLRKKIQLWLFKRKKSGGGSAMFTRSGPGRRPPALGFFGGPRRTAVRRAAPVRAPARAAAPRRVAGSGNKELDDTMRKLREMAK